MADSLFRAGPTAVLTTATTIYTTPSATTAAARELRVVNTTGGALTFKLSVGADSAGTRLVSDVSVPANGLYKESGLITNLAAAETLQAQASGLGLTMQVCGVEST